MTVYNCDQFIRQAIETIQNQTWTDYEFIIVDDGSTDSSLEIINKIAQTDSRIQVIESSHVGRSKALNLAVRSSHGSYIANIDSDDLCENSRFQCQMEFLRTNQEIGLLGTSYNIYDEISKEKYSRILPQYDEEIKKLLVKHMYFYHSSIIFRRDIYDTINGYDEQLPVSIDYDFCVRMACKSKIGNLPQVLVTQRLNQTAFFQKINGWVRYKANVKIRFNAWKNFSGNFFELASVINPFGILDIGLRKFILRIILHR